MLISTRGRYALRVLIDMAEHRDEGYIPLKEVAVRQGISEKYLEGILKALVKAGILNGVRGKGGGYKLAADPDQCTVGQILRLTEESIAPVACLVNGEECPRGAECRTVEMWRGLNQVIEEYLDGVTVGDLAKPGCPVQGR